jgi:putative ABC transport system ATP-binding protein
MKFSGVLQVNTHLRKHSNSPTLFSEIDEDQEYRMNMETGDEFIRIEDLSKGFLEGNQIRHVLNGCCLTIRKGEFIAIIGKSGTGKSTLLNLISGIDQVDSGRILLEGQVLTELDEHQRTIFRRNQIGFIFQFFNLIPTLTVLENVTLPLELNGISLVEAKNRASTLLTEVGLIDRLNTFPDRLSGGEQQRVAIARALVHDPRLVLADEPTGNLDEETGSQVLTLLDKLTRKVGKNLIMVTHSKENAVYADRVIELRDGCFGQH